MNKLNLKQSVLITIPVLLIGTLFVVAISTSEAKPLDTAIYKTDNSVKSLSYPQQSETPVEEPVITQTNLVSIPVDANLPQEQKIPAGEDNTQTNNTNDSEQQRNPTQQNIIDSVRKFIDESIIKRIF